MADRQMARSTRNDGGTFSCVIEASICTDQAFTDEKYGDNKDLSRATLLLLVEERHRQQGLAALGLHQEKGLRALNAAVLAAPTLHLLMNGPETLRLLALVAKTCPLLNLDDSLDVQILFRSEALRLLVRHQLEEIKGPGTL